MTFTSLTSHIGNVKPADIPQTNNTQSIAHSNGTAELSVLQRRQIVALLRDARQYNLVLAETYRAHDPEFARAMRWRKIAAGLIRVLEGRA